MIPQSRGLKININVDQANKLNRMLPRGYRLVSAQDLKKKQNQSKKKSKIVYVSVEQTSRDASMRRKKNQAVSYYQGQPIDNNPKIYYDSQVVSKKKQVFTQFPQKIKNKAPSRTMTIPLPVIEPVNQQRAPYTPKQVIQKIKSHPKFDVIVQLRDDFNSCTFDRIVSKCSQAFFTLQDLQNQLQEIFITIYQSYNKSLPIYHDAAVLQSYITNLINNQKAKLKELPKQQPQVEESSYLNLTKVPSVMNRKKTVIAKPEAKNITIMDKRILGQNIKKLPSQDLSEICKIVFETIETREQYIIDIDTLPLKKVKQLQIFVNGCIQRLQGFIDCQVKNDDDSSQSSFIINDDFD